MRSKCLFLLFLISFAYVGVSGKNHSSRPKLKRNDFPEDFIFGSATSAYQCEGAAHEDGRGPSIWDTYSEKFPEKIKDGSNGSIADDSYNLYKEDVNLLHQIGFDAYRFSISWSRILPRGDLKGGINQAGIDYYNNLINQLLLKGVKPFDEDIQAEPDLTEPQMQDLDVPAIYEGAITRQRAKVLQHKFNQSLMRASLNADQEKTKEEIQEWADTTQADPSSWNQEEWPLLPVQAQANILTITCEDLVT